MFAPWEQVVDQSLPGRSGLELAGRLRELDPHLVKFYIATCYPGTRLYEEALKTGCLDDPRWYLDKPGTSADPGTVAFEDLDPGEILRRAYRRFYFRPGYLFRLPWKALRSPYLVKHAFRKAPLAVSYLLGR